jgi:hypothetical protein
MTHMGMGGMLLGIKVASVIFVKEEFINGNDVIQYCLWFEDMTMMIFLSNERGR